MWRNLSINTKLLISLIALQACFLAMGSFWLINWIEKSKYQVLNDQLDSQTDVIEDLIIINDGKLFYQRGGEVASELDHDNDTYFELISDKSEFVSESEGPSTETRTQLKNVFSELDKSDENSKLLQIKHGIWLVQTESVNEKNSTNPPAGTIYVAINAKPMLAEIAEFKKIIFLSSLTMLLVTSLGSMLVVSYSTRNLKIFASQLNTLQLPSHIPKIELTPQSLEEKMLFDNYNKMTTSIKATIDNQRLFIANASHELKTPIAAAQSALEVTLSQRRSVEFYEETCRDILVEIKALSKLSANLLNLAKLEISDESNSSPCDLQGVLMNIYNRWCRFAEEKQIKLIIPKTNKSYLMTGASEQWDIILGNLIDNAIKYGKPNGHIWVTVTPKTQNKCEIMIKDDGIGMSESSLQQIGNLFFRADTARNNNNSFGLGLAHAMMIAEKISAKISIASDLNIGTCVTVSAAIVVVK